MWLRTSWKGGKISKRVIPCQVNRSARYHRLWFAWNFAQLLCPMKTKFANIFFRPIGHWKLGRQTLTECARPNSFGSSYLGSYGTQKYDFYTVILVGKVCKNYFGVAILLNSNAKQLQIIEEISTKKLMQINSRKIYKEFYVL